jgi:hypothetical protein
VPMKFEGEEVGALRWGLLLFWVVCILTRRLSFGFVTNSLKGVRSYRTSSCKNHVF